MNSTSTWLKYQTYAKLRSKKNKIDTIKEKSNLRYHGKSPKRRFPDNLNNYDHNILGLENRNPINDNKSHSKDDSPFFRYEHTYNRPKSQDYVKYQ